MLAPDTSIQTSRGGRDLLVVEGGMLRNRLQTTAFSLIGRISQSVVTMLRRSKHQRLSKLPKLPPIIFRRTRQGSMDTSTSGWTPGVVRRPSTGRQPQEPDVNCSASDFEGDSGGGPSRLTSPASIIRRNPVYPGWLPWSSGGDYSSLLTLTRLECRRRRWPTTPCGPWLWPSTRRRRNSRKTVQQPSWPLDKSPVVQPRQGCQFWLILD